jgi:hypothetical protein
VRLGRLTAIFDDVAVRKDSGMGDRARAAWYGPVAAVDGPRGVREDSADVTGEDGASG